MVAVIAVFGPTASGKTAVAEAIADRLGTGVVSCDALQVYRGLPILTNQPTRPTALVGIRGARARRCRSAPTRRSPTSRSTSSSRDAGAAVVSGGTGLYLRAALADLAVPPPPGAGVRERIRAEVETDRGGGPCCASADLDPRAADAVHPNDHRRLVRALELAETGGVARAGRRSTLGERPPGIRR